MATERDSHNETLVIEEARKTAIDAARLASNTMLSYWPGPSNQLFDRERIMQIIEKDHGVGNYATIADLESEEAIKAMIQKNPLFTTHTIVGEESDRIEGTSEWQWIIDPIDGTQAFRHGLPDFGVNIALFKGQKPIIGVIAMPALRQLMASQEGKGAYLYDYEGNILVDLREQQVEKDESFDKILVGFDTGYVERSRQLRDFTAKIADKIGYPVSYASSATANFRLAQGSLAAYFLQTPTIMDIAAPAAIISEVGGKVSDMHGEPIDWNADSRSYLAARNEQIHTQILEIFNT